MSSASPLAKATAQTVLALTLAFSICFPLPLEKAHALDRGQALAESDAGGSYADSGATGNDADASPQSDGSAANALSHAAESGNPIVDWTACGTCRWMIDARGCLTIAPMEGADSGELSYWKDAPWYDYRDSITSAKIKDGVVAATTFRMFRDCSRLISVDLSGLDTSKVTEMGREDTWESGMFSGCTRLAYLDVSSLDTSNVTSMGCMFEGCSSLTSLDLSTFDTSNVTCMDGTFDFAADKPVSFEQMITILARIAATPDEVAASRGDLSAFVDGDMASSWSRDSLAWAHDLGLVEGYNDPDRGKLLCPGENVERQRAATVLARAFTMGVLK